MAGSSEQEIEYEALELTVYRDGSFHRRPWTAAELAPPCPSPSHPDPDAASKDLPLNQRHGTSLRLFLPPRLPSSSSAKLPVLLFFHGGAFIHVSTRLRPLHAYLCRLAAHVNAVIVSVDYRLAPEHPLPAAYEDGFEALIWLENQAALGPSGEPWLAEHGDFSRCFLAGDSAGGTIVHYVGMQAVGHGSWKSEHGGKALEHVCVKGMLVFHPYFACGEDEELQDPIFEAKVLKYINVTNHHPLVDPDSPMSPPLRAAPLPRTRVFVAGLDRLKKGGLTYHQILVNAGKEASLSITEEEIHCFHVYKPDSPHVIPLLNEVKDFILNA